MSKCIFELKPRMDLEFGGLVDSSKVFWLVMVDLSFYMILGDSLWSKTSKGLPELVSRGVLELVGDFRRAKSLAFSLGRTSLTGMGPETPAICSDTTGL